jgi:hypothetical protein
VPRALAPASVGASAAGAADVSTIRGQSEGFCVVLDGVVLGAVLGVDAGADADAGAGRAFGASSESCNSRCALKMFEQRPQRTCPPALRSMSSLMRNVV